MANSNSRNKIRRIFNKYKMVMLLGGCCAHCGYNKNVSALTFHHLEYKNIPLSGHNLSSNSDELLLEELKGCALLCANCHNELHNPKLGMKKIGAMYAAFEAGNCTKTRAFASLYTDT